MNPVDKALWYVETHFPAELTLDQIASVAGVSRYHVSRAFREQFGQTLESVRAQRHLENLELVEAVTMNHSILAELPEPRFESRPAFLVAGLSVRYDYETCGTGRGDVTIWVPIRA